MGGYAARLPRRRLAAPQVPGRHRHRHEVCYQDWTGEWICDEEWGGGCRWSCCASHKRDCCYDSGGYIAGLVIFIICIACCFGICVYFCIKQSRSKNIPPPEQQPLMATPAQGQEHIQVGGRRPSTIQFASVAAMARHSPSAQVMVPAGAGPGTLVSAPHNGQTVQVTVPPGVGPGQYFTVAVPAAAPVATAQGTVVG